MNGAEVGQRRRVARVGEREDQEDQDRGADDLVEQRVRDADRRSPVAGQRREDALGLDGVARVDLGDQRRCRSNRTSSAATNAPDELGQAVRRDLAPREALEDGQREGDRGVEVPAADPAGDVDAERDADAPGPGDAVVLAGQGAGLRGGDDLGHHARRRTGSGSWCRRTRHTALRTRFFRMSPPWRLARPGPYPGVSVATPRGGCGSFIGGGDGPPLGDGVRVERHRRAALGGPLELEAAGHHDRPLRAHELLPEHRDAERRVGLEREVGAVGVHRRERERLASASPAGPTNVARSRARWTATSRTARRPG